MKNLTSKRAQSTYHYFCCMSKVTPVSKVTPIYGIYTNVYQMKLTYCTLSIYDFKRCLTIHSLWSWTELNLGIWFLAVIYFEIKHVYQSYIRFIVWKIIKCLIDQLRSHKIEFSWSICLFLESFQQVSLDTADKGW